MNIGALHLKFKERSGVAGGYGDSSPYEIDLKINEAQNWLIKNYKLIQRADSQLVKDLYAPFIVREEVNMTEISPNRLYIVSLDNLNHNYVQLEQFTYLCGDDYATVDIESFDTINRKLKDAHQKPSRKWNRSLATILDNKLYVYTEQKLNEGIITYIRRPEDVFFGGYNTEAYLYCQENGGTNCDNYYKATDDPVTSEFSDHYQELVVDVAVWLNSGKTANSLINQLTKEKLNFNNS